MTKQMNLLSEGQFFGQNNSEIEEMVLGAFVNYPDSYYQVADQIGINEFSTTETRYIYIAIQEVANSSKIDIATVTDRIIQKRYHEVMNSKNGFDLLLYLNEICERIDTDSHLKEHVQLLNKYAKRRALLMLSKNINERCNDMEEPDGIVGEIHTSLINIQEMGEVEEFNAEKSIDAILFDIHNNTKVDLVPSGIKVWDDFMQGWEAGELVIMAGAPSMGKTALALEVFKNCIFAGYNPIFFSLEMSDTALIKRMFANHADVELKKLRSNEYTIDDVKALEKSAKAFKEQKFWIDYKTRKISKICNHVRKFVIRHKTKIVFLDYLQLAICDDENAGNREQEIATMSRALKELAAELDIVIIALSQINRAVNTRVNKRPGLSDLRESGAIEQDADMVCFVFRPAYYDLENGPPPAIEEAELIIAKGRNTGVGKVDIKYVSKYTKYISKILTDEETRKYENRAENIQPDWYKAPINPNRDQELFPSGTYAHFAEPGNKL